MSRGYRPKPPPRTSLAALAIYLDDELGRVARELRSDPVLEVRHRPPERVVTGMMVFADGTDWNPGAGRGLYYWDGSWIKIA